eukprot:2114000-Rhodomonas_salina.3
MVLRDGDDDARPRLKRSFSAADGTVAEDLRKARERALKTVSGSNPLLCTANCPTALTEVVGPGDPRGLTGLTAGKRLRSQIAPNSQRKLPRVCTTRWWTAALALSSSLEG